ncbi:MAG: ABC transporter ATP-binding protein [Candidatus Eisenbacteria bacterium]
MVTTPQTVSLSAIGLTHRYGRRIALQPLEFELTSPGVVAVTGANGSGKSTLLRIVAGILRPSGGALSFALLGKGIKPLERRHAIGLATPELAFYEEFTARENLAFLAETRALAQPGQAVQNALECVQLETRADDRVADYSSGMKQRLRLASAILHRPAVLLLDEPGGHLDAEGRAVVERIVRQESTRSLVLLATNDPEEMRLATKLVELNGRGLGGPS